MAKIIDISDKLDFAADPVLVVNGQEFTIKSDAETVLKIMGAFDGQDEAKAVKTALDELFSPDDLARLLAIEKGGKKLTIRDLATIIEAGINAILDADPDAAKN